MELGANHTRTKMQEQPGPSAVGRLRGYLAGTVVVVALVSVVNGINPLTLMKELLSWTPRSFSQPPLGDDGNGLFLSNVLVAADDTWQSSMLEYRPPKLLLFRGSVGSACGVTPAKSGLFYCPSEEKVYLDLGLLDELHRRFGTAGDFAAAYVIAHEIGHHVQKLKGTSPPVEAAQDGQGASSPRLRFELQADCYAGLWAYDAQKRWLLTKSAVDDALSAASQVADTLQNSEPERVSADSFTHGTLAQRIHWFNVGFASGEPSACDTFSPATL